MGIFTAKHNVSPENALIGTYENGVIHWDEVDMEYAWGLFRAGVLEDRGYRTVNGIHYKLFFLPAPATEYEVEK